MSFKYPLSWPLPSSYLNYSNIISILNLTISDKQGSRCSTVSDTPSISATSMYLYKNFLFSISLVLVLWCFCICLISSMESLMFSFSLMSFSINSPFNMFLLENNYPDMLKVSSSLSISASGYSPFIICFN
jgi:hypothetical protein